MDDKLVNAYKKFAAGNCRNVSLLAHVDHGKTTLADHLISSCGIISARLAGQLRYMDSRDDEQERGITMKSSAITLLYDPLLLNLVDSPGHVDFCSEVDFAIQITDIALLIVDVVEGVCPQTEALLRQAINNKQDIILVINKMDRLVEELKLAEAEAFQHIQRLIEHINSCISQTLQMRLAEVENWQTFEEAEATLLFNATKWNVLFTSSLYGYGFSLNDFAALWKKKLPGLRIKREELCADMFSFDKYLDTKTMKVMSGAEQKGKKPLFQQLVLEPLWEVHKCALIEKDLDRLRQLAIKLALPPLKAKRLDDAATEFMRLWLPLTAAVIKACAMGKSPSKALATDERIDALSSKLPTIDFVPLCNALKKCDIQSPFCVLQIARLLKLEDRRVALVRVLCGTLTQDTEFHFPAEREEGGSEIIHIPHIFIPLGKELLPVECAPAGRICIVQVSSDQEWFRLGKWRTLYSTNVPISMSEFLLDFGHGANSLNDDVPLVQVTVQPVKAGIDAHWRSLRECLKMMSLMDKSMKVTEKENGDLVLISAGEVHLQKCLKDLHDMGQTDIVISKPIVPFMETIIVDEQSAQSTMKTHLQEFCVLNANQSTALTLRLRAIPIPESIVQLLQEEEAIIGRLRSDKASHEETTQLFEKLQSIARHDLPKMKGTWWWRKAEEEIAELCQRIWVFGPAGAKANLMINAIPDYSRPPLCSGDKTEVIGAFRPYDRAVISGFDLAISHGPLCDEPMQGVAIVVEAWDYPGIGGSRPDEVAPSHEPQLYGQVISAVKQSCLKAMKAHPLRLVAAMYKCVIPTSAQALGKVQSVLAQRRGKVISEDVNEMSGLLELQAYLPVVESFSFCEMLRKKTSGLASAQLRFSHWQIVDQDPFWEPTTEEEKEEFGQLKVTTANQARFYVDSVRKRKGLPIDKLIVVDAEKQRTLKKNK